MPNALRNRVLVCMLALAAPLQAQQGLAPLQVSPELVAPSQNAGGSPPRAPQAPSAFGKEQLEQLVAPIALYPDALVAQVLMASTYPLEVVQAARWAKENPKVTGKPLEDAMQKQSWDPSVKSLTATPQVLAMMNDKLDWMQKLGDAFLAQQKEVLDSVQRLRAKALAEGNLKSGKEQKITSEQEGSTTVIKIEPTNPEVVYVPVYNPTMVYGPWPYPMYPPYYYYPPAYAGGVFFAFSVGIVIGSAWWGGCHWGGGNVYINHHNYNNFNKTNISGGDWQHRPEHRKGVEYRDQGSRDKYAGQRPSAGTHDQFRGRADSGQRDRDVGGGNRDIGGSNRDIGGGSRDIGSGGRGGSGAFDGVGNGAQTRDHSNRGASSRASAGGFGGGGRGGGGRGGGGRR